MYIKLLKLHTCTYTIIKTISKNFATTITVEIARFFAQL